VPVIVVGGMPFESHLATSHCLPVQVVLMHWPSLVQVDPSPHWLPEAVQTASHLPSGEQ
jgi:hypothetical protein